MLYFIYLIRGIFLSLLLAVVLAYLLHPLVRMLESRGSSRTASILIVYAVVFILAAGLLLYGMPHIIAQLNTIRDVIPEYAVQVQEFTDSLQLEYARAGIPGAIRQIIDERITWLEQILVQMAERVVQNILGLAGYLFNIILAPIFAYYLLKDIEIFTDRTVMFIPARWRGDVLELGRQVSRVIDSFVRGYLLVSVITGLLTGVVLAFLKVEFALMLGIFAGLTNLIPYFGPFIGAVPAVALAMLVSKWLVLKVIIAFILIQQAEASIISPKILGDRVGLHPLVVILAVLAGGQLFGLAGLILAVPVAAILRVFIYFAAARLLPEFN
ncbi:Predicted PurR-regulated permease PerM [Desulfoscipio geothermicus DSM 3669]|uniref:Predicted PurR-regulated permease PerM n=2 Tax=Desulfoscipio geothermicus TaxID=39060 RepID=A0A1I6DBY9_9FIRM|nr:Predicted PurR-regulated permease PerM [Desulfoscipio geothermicus DSM 3669]